MKRKYIESSMMASFGYDPGSLTLEIEFVSGAVWQYLDVQKSVYNQMKSASSFGKFLQTSKESMRKYELDNLRIMR
jgi:KTSC domain